MIVLVGGGGIPNYGDELIIDNWLRWYQEGESVVSGSIHVEGYNSQVLSNTFARRFPDASWGHAIRDARLRFRKASFWRALDAGWKVDESTDPVVRSAKELIDSASVVHVHGGGYLNDMWPSHAFVLGLAASAARARGAQAVATGIGMRPLADPEGHDRAVLNEVVSTFSLVEVRDRWSYDFLIRNLEAALHSKVIMGLDDAFLRPVAVEERNTRTLHLAVLLDDVGEVMIDRLSPSFVDSFDHHRFWVCKPADASAYVKLSERYKFFELCGPSQLIQNPHIAPQDVLITERFHPHLQAARAGASGVYSAVSDYYETKHGSLVTLGSPFEEYSGEEFREESFVREDSLMHQNDAAYVARKRSIARSIAI